MDTLSPLLALCAGNPPVTCGFLAQRISHPDINGLVQERCNASAIALELHLSCINSSIWHLPCSQMNPHLLNKQLSDPWKEMLWCSYGFTLANRKVLRLTPSQPLGLYSIRRLLTGIGIPIINLRRSDDRLRFIMGIPILVRRGLLSETRPWR